MTAMLIAIPYPSLDDNDCPEPVDEWDMLMRDLRDDVERIHDMPALETINVSEETLYGRFAYVFRFDVDDDLAAQLLASAYAQSTDLVIERA